MPVPSFRHLQGPPDLRRGRPPTRSNHGTGTDHSEGPSTLWPLDPEEARAPQGRQQRGVTQWAQESGHVLGGNSAVCLRQVQQRQCLPVPGRRSEDRFIWDSLKAARRRSVHQAATSRLCSKAASRAPGGKEEAGGRSVSRAGLATGCHVPSSLCSRPRSFPAMRGSATLLAAVTLPP